MVKSVYSAGRIYSRSVIGYTQHQSSVWSAKVCPVNDRSRCRVDFSSGRVQGVISRPRRSGNRSNLLAPLSSHKLGEVCPGSRTMLATESNVEVRHEFLQRMTQARSETDKLFELVKSNSLYARPIPERHRIVFYIGHLEAFDWNLLRERVVDARIFHPDFDRLFAFGIDPVGGGLPSDQPGDWPTIPEVQKYVSRVRQTLDDRLATVSPSDHAGDGFSASTLLNVAIEHRLMHAETLAYMLHQLPLDAKIRQGRKPELVAASITPRMVEIPAGRATMGLLRASGNFGWDNEFEERSVEVPAFAIDKYKLTNREYLEFLNAGGYENREYWTDADWNWKTQQSITHPVFWRRENGQWFLRTMFDELPLPPDWPVYVSRAEASAYARWAGQQVPTEAQWHRGAYGTEDEGENAC